jgi:hypothetical protein
LLPKFNFDVAWQIGSLVRDLGLIRGSPIVVDVRSSEADLNGFVRFILRCAWSNNETLRVFLPYPKGEFVHVANRQSGKQERLNLSSSAL